MKESRQACYFSSAHPPESKAVPDRKSSEPQPVLHIRQKWHTDINHEIDLGLNTTQTFSDAVVHFGDIAAKIA